MASGAVPCNTAGLRVRQGGEVHSWILYLNFVPKAGQGTLWGPESCCVVF